MKTSVDALSRSFAELNTGLREEREQRGVQMDQLSQRLSLRSTSARPASRTRGWLD